MAKATVPSSRASISVTATTASVFEHVCLFTHDLRRKQKRWQDGRLKFHSFNKRIMVHDEAGNFVGDTHWREDYDFEQGEEFELERGGIIVQVAECIASRQQDLSELIDKRAQERAGRQAAAALHRPSLPRPSGAAQGIQPSVHTQHRPLGNVLVAPSGHYGRAFIPQESPFETRQKNSHNRQDENETPQPAKRKKRTVTPPSKNGYAQSLFGAALTLSSAPMSSVSSSYKPQTTFRVMPDLHQSSPMPAERSNQEQARLIYQQAQHTAQSRHHNSVTVTLEQEPKDLGAGRRSIAEALPPGETRSNATWERNIHLASPDPFQGSRDETDNHTFSATEPASACIEMKGAPTDTTSASLEPVRQISSSVHKSGLDLAFEPPGIFSQNTVDYHNEVKLSRKTKTHKVINRGESLPEMAAKYPNIVDTQRLPRQNRNATQEPRVELRIRPRKKRGLVMLQDRNTWRQREEGPVPQPTDVDWSDPFVSPSEYPAISNVGHTSEVNRDRQRLTTAEPIREVSHCAKDQLVVDQIGVQDHNNNDNMSQFKAPRRIKLGDTQPRNPLTKKEAISMDHTKPPLQVSPTIVTNQSQTGRIMCNNTFSEMGYTASQHESTGRIKSNLEGVQKVIRTSRSTAQLTDVYSAKSQNERPNRLSEPPRSDKQKTTVEGGHATLLEELETSMANGIPAPRLAHLGRKSIRSREVIGFPFEPSQKHESREDAQEEHQSTNQNTRDDDQTRVANESTSNSRIDRIDSSPAQAVDNPSTPKPQLDSYRTQQIEEMTGRSSPPFQPFQQQHNETEHSAAYYPQINLRSDPVGVVNAPRTVSAEYEVDINQAPKLLNPATRGRKAAKPSDAAGQLPAVVVPFERVNTSGDGRKRSLRTAQGGIVGGQAKDVSSLPGFSTANGGPWSREAFDLFEFSRPR